MEYKCPKCGAEKAPWEELWPPKLPNRYPGGYKCGSICMDNNFRQSSRCKDRQIATLQSQLTKRQEERGAMEPADKDYQHATVNLLELQVEQLQTQLTECQKEKEALSQEIEGLQRCYESAAGKPVCGEGSVIRMECQEMTALRQELEVARELVRRFYTVDMCFNGKVLFTLGQCRKQAEDFLIKYDGLNDEVTEAQDAG